jgi:hypothetical protein
LPDGSVKRNGRKKKMPSEAMMNDTPPLTSPTPRDTLVEALTKCRDKFREYERMHLAKVQAPDRGDILDVRDKANAEAEAKAQRNREMADMCDAALINKLDTEKKA